MQPNENDFTIGRALSAQIRGSYPNTSAYNTEHCSHYSTIKRNTVTRPSRLHIFNKLLDLITANYSRSNGRVAGGSYPGYAVIAARLESRSDVFVSDDDVVSISNGLREIFFIERGLQRCILADHSPARRVIHPCRPAENELYILSGFSYRVTEHS